MKKVKIILGFFVFFSFSYKVVANDPPKGCRSYNLKVETVCLVDEQDKEGLTASDYVSMRFPTEVRFIEECPEETINTLLNVEEVYQSWMPQYAKTVTNREGLKFLDEKGNILYSYSPEELSSERKEVETTELSDDTFEAVLNNMDKMKEDGDKIETTETGFKVQGENYILYIDKQKHSTYFVILDKETEVFTERTVYSSETNTIVSKTEEQFLITPSGKHFTKVVIKTYSNYKVM